MKPNIKLLKRLRTRFLRMRHPKHFDMHPVAAASDCGAVMCIAGHTLDLAGYKMRLRPKLVPKSCGLIGRMDFDFVSPDGDIVSEPLEAAETELKLDSETAYDLFHDFSLKTPKQAAKRIEKLIAEHESDAQ